MFSFQSVVKVGMLIQKTLSEFDLLERDIAEWVMIHNLHEESPISTSEKDSVEQVQILIKIIEPRITQINSQIKGLNRIATLFKTKQRIVLVDKKMLYKLLRQRFGVLSDKKAVELNNENFNLKKAHLFQVTHGSIFRYVESMNLESGIDDLYKISPKYAQQLRSAIAITSIGIHDVSVFTAGRAVEDCVNAYIRKLKTHGKISRVKVKELKLDTKIGILKKNGFINEKEFYDLSSVRVSRNDTGHPKRASFNREDALLSIKHAVSIIMKIEKKMKKLPTKKGLQGSLTAQ